MIEFFLERSECDLQVSEVLDPPRVSFNRTTHMHFNTVRVTVETCALVSLGHIRKIGALPRK